MNARMVWRLAALPLLMLLTSALQENRTAGKDDHMEPYYQSLNGVWNFRVDPDDVGVSNRWFDGFPADAPYDTLRVPGFWDQLGDLAEYDGYGWYLRHFDVDADSTLRYALVFEAVDDNADIWLNGMRVGSHIGYGRRFTVDITNAMRARKNLLAVRVEDLGGPGGIMGNVALRSYRREGELLESRFHHRKPVESADWVRDAVLYEVFPRAFSEEGSFRAVEQRLPEIKELGATVIWLMPIHPIGELKRKGTLGSPYSIRDYYAINPEYGTMEDFRSLLARTHELGMHLIIDLVINHTSWDHPFINEHPAWYARNSKGEIVSPNVDWYDIAQLDFNNQALREYMMEMMMYWVRDVGVDGFRCDYSDMIPHDFWSEAIEALREVKPVMLLAEGANPQLHVNAFDISYAWNTYDILHPMLEGELPISQFAVTMQREFYQYPVGALHLRFIVNHDKHKEDNPAVTWLGVRESRSCAVLVSLLPGVPLIYNGQEVGNDRQIGLFEKEVIDWEDAHGLRPFYTELTSVRREHEVLRRGEYRPLALVGNEQVVAYVRSYGGRDMVVAVNLTDEAARVALPMPANCAGVPVMLDGCRLLDEVKGEWEMEPWGYVVLR
ncbi:DUF3459 domain-containing protein [bacterium]|nr:DUF3459 domain-containing protein [bacterium]